MVELSDLELIRQSKEGSEVAFEHIFRRYEPLIAKIARKYYISSYEKEDFYQIGSMAFYEAVLSFEEKESFTFYGYVLTCVRNKIVSQCRKQLAKADEYATDHEKIATVMESCEMYTVEKSEVLDEENNTTLYVYRNELSKLLSKPKFFSSRERICLEGHMNGLSYLEIAEKEGMDSKTVDNALMRARTKIRERDLTGN